MQFLNFSIKKKLIIQIIFGINFHDIFWFQFDLIILTLVYNIINFIFKTKLYYFLMVVSYIVQYSDFFQLFQTI